MAEAWCADGQKLEVTFADVGNTLSGLGRDQYHITNIHLGRLLSSDLNQARALDDYVAFERIIKPVPAGLIARFYPRQGNRNIPVMGRIRSLNNEASFFEVELFITIAGLDVLAHRVLS